MGSVSLKIGDGTARFRRSTLCSSALHLLMLASVLTTNLFALYAFTQSSSQSSSSSAAYHPDHENSNNNLSLISEHVSLILREIDASSGGCTRWSASCRASTPALADFPLDDVLALAAGGVRVGFDVAGGAADFAAGMAERNVTVVTSVVDSPGKPLNELVAARGLFPLLLAPAHRFPFYDAVFDLVHLSAALDEGGAPALGRSGRQEALEFLLFDIDRILRVGGLLWIDNYLCADDDRKRAVTRLIERFAYKKLKWVVGEKADPGKKTPRVYLSAVLQKPPRVSKD
ncbi:hypothetical protein ACMD2_02713 [Ananas comosus]|uniref:Methyltransferase type 11 domain-containing protein n=1 Tax=Ananas comosus TaxID=4615 RepID=A0A199VMH3_ANACO|nr:hypothetical protein ACMD2_02713 [Ananas comosus]